MKLNFFMMKSCCEEIVLQNAMYFFYNFFKKYTYYHNLFKKLSHYGAGAEKRRLVFLPPETRIVIQLFSLNQASIKTNQIKSKYCIERGESILLFLSFIS